MNKIVVWHRNWKFRLLMLILPFACALPLMLITQDRIPKEPAIRLLDNVIVFGALIVSLLAPLVSMAIERTNRMAKLFSVCKYLTLWVVVQIVAVAALAILSILLFGDGL